MVEQDRDFYELLGVEPTSTPSEIKEAFRRLAQQYHPDRGSITPDHVELFKRITEAYRVLSNAESRNLYNKEQGYLFHESVTIGGVGAENSQSTAPTGSISISGVERDWRKLHRMAGGTDDLKVDQRVAQTAPEEMEKLKREGADVSAWGDLEGAPVSGGILSNLLGNRKKDRTSFRRGELKKQLKNKMQEESIPKKPSKIFDTPQKAKARPGTKSFEDSGGESIADPLRRERVFTFQISALEAALGTTREAVFSAGRDDKLNKVSVEIPPGTAHGAVLEVARGWERAQAQITVVQDPNFEVRGNDIYLRVPITLKEALDGARITVPGIRGVHEITLPSGQLKDEGVIVEGAGIPAGGVRGSLIVIPFIVAPTQQLSATLTAAAAAIDTHYSGDIRSDFNSNPLVARFCSEEKHQLSFFPPITFGEALRGVDITIRIRDVSVLLRVPPAWDFRKELLSADYVTQLQQVIRIQPAIALPQRSSGDLQAAALAVEQHFLQGPRSAMPRSLAPR